ncbi:response regulator containing a CheY-like receiver domain and a GGDEF domain [Lachnospiraceae bacterium KM106-2]|nr:response regulator containing a CheY-like receiver domain and a GGDEF domain [Lachnospiraceae bacterium KM106-2]
MKEKVLIIDDSLESIQTLTSILHEDYQVITARDGLSGIRLVNRYNPSLILLDIIMPGMNGFEVLQQLQNENEDFSIPVIFITCLQDEQSEEQGLRMGAVDYIMKPFNERIIKVKVHNHIKRMRYRRNMEDIAMLDGLTGIPNRRSYDVRFQLDWRACKKENTTFSMAIADIDYFKDYNDNYGHMQGDEVLRRIAGLLQSIVTPYGGIVARYGGEEFVFLFRNKESMEAKKIMEEVRAGVEALKIKHHYSKCANYLTISVGGHSIVPSEEISASEFVERVDRRLYQAKGQGKNRVVWEGKQLVNGQIECFLLNDFSVLSSAGSVSAKTGMRKKCMILFLYLIVNRYEKYSKEDLYHCLFQDEEREWNKLTAVFAELKKALEQLEISYARELVVPINGIYHWNNNYMCMVDAEVFTQIINEMEEAADQSQKAALAKHAVELYQTDFMNEITDVTWINELRNRYRIQYRKALHYYLIDRMELKHYHEVIEKCQRDSLVYYNDEELNYYYLLALIKDGKEQEAIEHYEYLLESCDTNRGAVLSERITRLSREMKGLNPKLKEELLNIKDGLTDSGRKSGPLECNEEMFEQIYQIESRNLIRNEKMCYLCMIKIVCQIQDKVTHQMDRLQSTLKGNLRIGDAYTKKSSNKFCLLLPNVNYKYGNIVLERIRTAFIDGLDDPNVSIQYELVPIEPIR